MSGKSSKACSLRAITVIYVRNLSRKKGQDSKRLMKFSLLPGKVKTYWKYKCNIINEISQKNSNHYYYLQYHCISNYCGWELVQLYSNNALFKAWSIYDIILFAYFGLRVNPFSRFYIFVDIFI